jgi:hypothetical protein
MHNMFKKQLWGCNVRYNPSSVEADPEVEVVNAPRFPPGVNTPRDALQEPPPSDY